VASRVSQMDEMVLWAVLTVVLLVVVIYFQLSERGKLADGADGLHERLDVLEDSLKIVGAVLEQLPALMPSFHMPGNPLTQILEFLAALRGEGETPSNVDAALRGPEGRFSDGTTEESSPPETT
jgi:hypothetical protein